MKTLFLFFMFVFPYFAKANSQNTIKTFLFDVQFIVNNESFTLQEVYFKNAVRHCVFESPSALWTIRHCHFGGAEAESLWFLVLAGEFSIKDTDRKLRYYMERESHVYKNIEQGSLFFNDVSYMKIFQGDFSVVVGSAGRWSKKRLPFFQNLARKQEQYINQSVTGED